MCVYVVKLELYLYPPLSLLQSPPKRQKARRTTKRRALNSVSEKTGPTTPTHLTSLNSLKWSITAPSERAPDASTLRELLKMTQIFNIGVT